MSFWTDNRVDLLKKLWADGVSASLIASQMGEITRNAVIGKAYRLGLESRKPEVFRAPKPPPKPPARSNLGRGLPRDKPACSFGGEPEADDLAPDNQRHEQRQRAKRRPPRILKKKDFTVIPQPDPAFRCTILDLTSTSCRWPIGDPRNKDFCFCGMMKPNDRNVPYCGFHAKMATPRNETEAA